MLRSSARALNPEMQLLVDEIVNEETRAIMRERRDASRLPLTRAVKITLRERTSETFEAITRDISNIGIGLIGKNEWERGAIAKLEIDRLERGSATVLAECRWCDRFNDDWCISGWNFMNVLIS